MATAANRVEVLYEIPTTDPRWVLHDDVNEPESVLQDKNSRKLVDVLEHWISTRGVSARAGSNIALRWDPDSPQVGVDPDVYLVEPDMPEGELARSLCTWKPGHHAPRVCIEVVSERTAEKDYGDGPDRYAASGVHELWVFDPRRCGSGSRGGPFLLQVWRRDARGRFRRVYAGDKPARSEELDAWIVPVDEDTHLRIADDPEGVRLWPTRAEYERAEKERERAEKERERAEKESLIARLAVLEAELARRG